METGGISDKIGQAGEGITLHVLHTNDFHNRLTDVGAARIRQAVADLRGEPYVLIDAGDAIKAGNVGVSPFGEPILGVMSDLGYHAMTMGNREFHVWKLALETKIANARFPILCANIRARQEGATLPVTLHPSVTIETGGLKVTILGVTVPMVTERMKVAALSSFVFDNPIETLARLVVEHRYAADVVIALTHIGLRDDRMLAEKVPGIDLVVGGHSHVVLNAPETVGRTPIVQAGSHARYFGHVQMRVERGGVSLQSATLHPLQLQEARD